MHHFALYYGCNLQPSHLSILLLTECHFSYQVHLKKYQIIFLIFVTYWLSTAGFHKIDFSKWTLIRKYFYFLMFLELLQACKAYLRKLMKDNYS